MVVRFTTTYAISAYHYWCEFESQSGQGIQYYVIKFVWLVTCQWFSPSNKQTSLDNVRVTISFGYYWTLRWRSAGSAAPLLCTLE
jgi:hypothetical protein